MRLLNAENSGNSTINPGNEPPVVPPAAPEGKEKTEPVKESVVAEFTREKFKTELKEKLGWEVEGEDLVEGLKKYKQEPQKFSYKHELGQQLDEIAAKSEDPLGEAKRFIENLSTDWDKVAKENPDAILLKAIRADNPLLTDAQIELLFRQEYAAKLKKVTPDMDEDEVAQVEADNAELKQLADLKKLQKVQGILPSLKEAQKNYKPIQRSEPDPTLDYQVAELSYSNAAKEAFKNMSELKFGDFRYNTGLVKDGKLTPEGSKFMDEHGNLGGSLAFMFDDKGVPKADEVFKAAYLMKNFDAILKAHADNAVALHEEGKREWRENPGGREKSPASGSQPVSAMDIIRNGLRGRN